jgi:meso-butanediol dehydrogenase/(S,S)-butanediol dehydrogenase/diacetyl reductase
MIAVITGGSSGIGLATAWLLGRGANTVYVMDLNRPPDDAVAAGLRFVNGDVSRHGDWLALAELLSREQGRVDWLVNAAGITQMHAAGFGDDKVWRRVLGVNVMGAVYSLETMTGLMTGGGAIVNIASVAAYAARPSRPSYGVSKAGIVSLTRSASLMLVNRGIRVNAVAPGLTDTPAWSQLPPSAGASEVEDYKRSQAEKVPIGRFASPDEIAQVIAFLLSDAASYIVGQTVNVCGGLTATDAMSEVEHWRVSATGVQSG